MRDVDYSNPIFHDEAKAREWLERRLWPEGPICPHCGVVNQATQLKGKAHRAGLYQCKACQEQFTVMVGTLYERSHLPLNKWLAATHLMMASKKGMSALQISRMIGVTYKTAWFLCHRIRERNRRRRGLVHYRQRQALFENTARSLAGVPEEIQQRHIGHCGKADRRYGDGVAEAIRQLRKGTP